MYKFGVKVNKNEMDTEIDEFGEINSLDVKSKKMKVSFRRKINPKIRERKKYDRTGICQLGTTYPNPYDREEFIDLSKKNIVFYRNNAFIFIATIFVIIIDFFCYFQMLTENLLGSEYLNDYKIYLISIGIAIAIDVLPIFFAHNLHRREIKRRKVIKIFNCIIIVFIILFIAIVFIYRINNNIGVNVSNSDTNNKTFEVFLKAKVSGDVGLELFNKIINSLLYVMIPIATSLFCFIINYLSYNPIAKMIINKRKEVLFKQEYVNELKATIAEIQAVQNYQTFLTTNDTAMYNSASQMIDSIGDYYKAYVRTEIMKMLKSPADTTDLSK